MTNQRRMEEKNGKAGGKSKSGWKNDGGKSKSDGSWFQGKSKNDKGKTDKKCHTRQKTGHMWKECWKKDDPAFAKQKDECERNQEKFAGSKSKSKGSKNANSLETEEPEEETGALDLCSVDKPDWS